MNHSRRLLALLLPVAWWCCGSGVAAAGEYRQELDNGLVILFKPNPSALTLAVCVFVRATALVETRDTAGLRHLAQQCLLDSRRAGGQTLGARVAAEGMTARVQVSPDFMETVLLGTGDQLPAALSLARDVLQPGSVEAAQLSLRRAQVLQELRSRREVAAWQAQDMALGHLFGNTPCAWPVQGTFAAMSRLSATQVQALWRARMAPNNALVAISGNLSWEAVQEQSRRALASLLPRQLPPEPVLVRTTRSRRAFLYAPSAAPEAVVQMVAPLPPPDSPGFAAAALLAGVLGSGEGSRLFRTLRDERGLVYSVTTDITPSRLSGMMSTSVECDADKAVEVCRLMQWEVAGLKRELPTEAEISRARAYLTGNYLLGHQRNSEVAHYLGLFEILFPGVANKDLPSRLAAVTPREVESAANWFLDHAFWVQVGGTRAL
jgi:predicted Zn-dependent peptidase